MSETSHVLEFVRSDGNPARWPIDKLDPTPDAHNEVNYMRPVALDEPLSVKWKSTVGREVAKLMGYPDNAKYILKSFPEGYKFYHQTKGSANDPRTDPYLYGAPSGRYRSPFEFIPHAYWLMTDETLDRSNCNCKYCAPNRKQKQISQELGFKSSAPVASPSLSPAKSKIRPVAQPQKLTRNVINHDRTADLRSTRCFRVGELVWCALSPAVRGTNPMECIDFWPGLISEARLKSEITPHDPREQWKVVQSNVYKVKLLAVANSHVFQETELLPYQAYGPSEDLIETLRGAGDPARLQIMEVLVQFNPVASGGAESNYGSPLRFVEASTSFALAIQVAAHLVRLWTPSDEWTFHGEAPPATQSSNSAIGVKITETRYQGIWWGAERIWAEELVRIQLGRSHVVPQGSQIIRAPSPGAEERGVLLRINSIFSEPRGPSAVRECKVAGVLYELALDTYEEVGEDVSWHAPATSANPESTDILAQPDSVLDAGQTSMAQQLPSVSPPISSPINIPSFPAYELPEPPPGFKFRQITKRGSEIILDVSLIAGRYYPRLFKHPLLQATLADVEMNRQRVTQLGALCGLLAGSINSTECIEWVGTRLAMVKMSDLRAQNDLHRYWYTSASEQEHQKNDNATNQNLTKLETEYTEMRDLEMKDTSNVAAGTLHPFNI